MKKKLILLALLLGIAKLNAQDENQKRRDNDCYLNLGYAFQSFESKETSFLSLKSDYVVSITFGKTFFLHEKPIRDCIYFGVDWSFVDLNFADYTKSYRKEYGVGKSYLFQLEAGMQVGPSIMVNPASNLNCNAYFRYAPSFSSLYNGEFEPFAYNYAGFFVTGIGMSYKMFSLGIEKRWGNANYEFHTEDDYGVAETHKRNWATNATRIYISKKF